MCNNYSRFASSILCLNILLDGFKLVLIVAYSGVLNGVCFIDRYSLSLKLIYFIIPCVIHCDLLW